MNHFGRIWKEFVESEIKKYKAEKRIYYLTLVRKRSEIDGEIRGNITLKGLLERPIIEVNFDSLSINSKLKRPLKNRRERDNLNFLVGSIADRQNLLVRCLYRDIDSIPRPYKELSERREDLFKFLDSYEFRYHGEED